MKTQDRIAVGWCDPGEVGGAFAADLMHLTAARGQWLAETIRVRSGGLLSRGRNMLVAQFLNATDAQWLLMIDTDHRVPVAAFDLLTKAAHDTAAPVVAGLCFGAWPADGPYPRPIPIAYERIEGSYTPISSIEPRGLRRVDGVGTGCLLIHRSVLADMRADVDDGLKDWCWFQDGPTGDGRWMSEDLTFCARLNERDIPIHVHTNAVLPHLKEHWESEETYNLWRLADEQRT